MEILSLKEIESNGYDVFIKQGNRAVVFQVYLEAGYDTYYSYEEVMAALKNDPSLLNKDLPELRDKEETEEEVRTRRNSLIKETDWTQLADVNLSDKDKEKYKIYREKLRNITLQEGFPFKIEWPEL